MVMMMCAQRIRDGHADSQLWAGVRRHASGIQTAQLAKARQFAWRQTPTLTTEPVHAMVPRTTVIELDDGSVLHGAPGWPEWASGGVGMPPPMWVTDRVDDHTTQQLVELFPTTGLWPVRLLEDSGDRSALIPVQRPSDIPARLCWRIPGRGRDTGVTLSALLRSWEDRLGAELIAIGHDTVVLDVKSTVGPNWVLCWGSDGQPTRPRLTTE